MEYCTVLTGNVVIADINVGVVDPKWGAMDINAVCVWRLQPTPLFSVGVQCLRPVHYNLHVPYLHVICPELEGVVTAIRRSEIPQRNVARLLDRDELWPFLRGGIRPPRRAVAIDNPTPPNRARNAQVNVDKRDLGGPKVETMLARRRRARRRGQRRQRPTPGQGKERRTGCDDDGAACKTITASMTARVSIRGR